MNERRFNALKTGAYASEIILPWESAVEFEKIRREIFTDRRPQGRIERGIVDDHVENRWLRQRLRQITAIEAHRHPVGKVLERSGATSWKHASKILQERSVAREKSIQSVATPMLKVAQIAKKLEPEMSEDCEELLRQVLDVCSKSFEELDRIRTERDVDQDFFDAYAPKNLKRLVQLENALDAQFDKLCARLLREQEARIVRDKLPRIDEDAVPLDDVEEGAKEEDALSGDTANDDAKLNRDETDLGGKQGGAGPAKLHQHDDDADCLINDDTDDDDWDVNKAED